MIVEAGKSINEVAKMNGVSEFSVRTYIVDNELSVEVCSSCGKITPQSDVFYGEYDFYFKDKGKNKNVLEVVLCSSCVKNNEDIVLTKK